MFVFVCEEVSQRVHDANVDDGCDTNGLFQPRSVLDISRAWVNY
jgi:hypothetical protein